MRSTSSPARRSSSSSASSNGACRSRRADGAASAGRHARTRRARSFEAGVRTIKEHIAAGDIYQAVLSQRFEADVTADPFTVYRALRHVNPSPYMYFIRMGGLAIVGSSPEMLVRVEGRRAETHPIAGTRPRGTNEDEDLRLGEELKRNEKERAEHVMLVDLGRNDLGRVCEFGIGARAAVHGARALLARDAPRLDGRRQAGRGSRSPRRAGRLLPGRHGVRRAEDPRDADPRRRSSRRGATSTPARSATSTSPATSTSASRSARSPSATASRGSRPAPASSPTRTRRRNTRKPATRRGRCCRRSPWRKRGCDLSSSTTTTRSPSTWRSTSASWARRRSCAQRRDHARRGRDAAAGAHRDLAGPGPPEDAGISVASSARFGPDHAGARRLPRPSGHRPRLRRLGRPGAGSRCTARCRRSSTTGAACSSGVSPPFVGGALSLARHRRDRLPDELEVARPHRRRHDHGACGTARSRCTASSSTPSRC